ncbi:MAG: hypothetical protein R3F43_14445 [bacterium]
MSAALTDFAPNHYGDAGTKRRLRLAMYVALVPFGLALLGYRGHRRRRGGGLAGLRARLRAVPGAGAGLHPGYLPRLDAGHQERRRAGARAVGPAGGAYLLGTAITSLYVILYWFPGPWPGWCR